MPEVWWKVMKTSGAQVYSLLAGTAILMITARWLGPAGRGEIAAVTAWVALFGTLGCLSLGQVAIHRATTLRGRPWLGATLGSLAVLGALVTFLGWGVAASLFVLSHGAAFGGLPALPLAVGFAALPFAIFEQYCGALLMAVDHVEVYNLGQVIGRTVGLSLVVLAWSLQLNVVGVLGAILISQGIVAFFGAGFLLRLRDTPMSPDRSTIKDLLRGAVRLHPNYVGGFLVTSCSILIVNHYLGAVQTGQYQAAQQLLAVLLVVPQGASMVMYGQVAQRGPGAAWADQRNMVAILMLSMVGLAAIAAILAPRAVPLVLGNEFDSAVGLFQTLLLTLFGVTLATVMSSQWIGRGLFLHLSWLTIGLGTLSVTANLVLVPRYGTYGAAWISVGAYALAAGAQSWLIFKCQCEFRGDRQPIYEHV